MFPTVDQNKAFWCVLGTMDGAGYLLIFRKIKVPLQSQPN